ncbi:MAG: endonuclease, partial [Deinococcus sp.]|nr:endonuclease [Deinococcus sp.]
MTDGSLFPELPAPAPAGALNATQPAPVRAELLAWMAELLRAEYGERPLIPRRAPMHELISTILSQR